MHLIYVRVYVVSAYPEPSFPSLLLPCLSLLLALGEIPDLFDKEERDYIINQGRPATAASRHQHKKPLEGKAAETLENSVLSSSTAAALPGGSEGLRARAEKGGEDREEEEGGGAEDDDCGGVLGDIQSSLITALGEQSSSLLWNDFTRTVQESLHIIISLSPVGKSFRYRFERINDGTEGKFSSRSRRSRLIRTGRPQRRGGACRTATCVWV